MTAKVPSSEHPIAHVRTLQRDGTESRDDYVACTRRCETVPLSTCAHCPRMLKVAVLNEHDAVQCVSEVDSTYAAQQPLSLPRLSVGSLMTRNVVCVRPDLTLDAATQLFVESGLKAAPVVDNEGSLLGFVTESDVVLEVQARTGSAEAARTVGDVMMPYRLALPETATVTRAAALMAFEGQPRIAVVSRAGCVIGVLSASDIMYWIARADGHILPRPRAR